jgi:hypothetical protein
MVADSSKAYLPFFLGARWDKALPAAVLLALLVRLSRRTLDAAFAAFALVCLPFAILNSLVPVCSQSDVRPVC